MLFLVAVVFERLIPYLWQVQVDLVSIEVCVECGAVGVMHADGALPSQHASPAGGNSSTQQ
jgi:hypothetical protein